MSMREDVFERLDSETENEFIAKVYRHKTELGMNNKEIADKLNNVLGTSYGESTLRGRGQYFNEGYSIGYEKALSDREENNLIKELEEKKTELEKEKIRYRDQKREYMNFVRQEARWEHLRDTIIEEVRQMNTSNPIKLDIVDFNISEGNKACLLISDLHIGSIIDTYTNKYNMEIAQIRLNKLEAKTISYCKMHGVDELNIELLGDLLSGIIHVTTRLYNEENIIQQTIKASEMLGNFIGSLAKYIPSINIYYSVGNHGRVTANYKEHIDEENFEYLIKWYLQARLENVPNIEFKENIIDEEIALIEIFDKKIISVHGHKDKLKSAIDKLREFTRIMIDEVHCGHYHNVQMGNGILVNGCMSGSDKYAQSLRFNNEPSQVLKIYYKNGDECIQNIKLN